MTSPPAGGRRQLRLPVAAWKGLASTVIVVCLGVQAYAVVRPNGARLYPFLAYPMYSRSRPPGETYQVRELWARTCDAHPRAWQFDRRALGYVDTRFLVALGGAVGDRPAARRYRAQIADFARAHLTPRPCVIQVWMRAVPTTRAGVDVDALRHPRRVLLWEWPVDDPGAARTLPPR